jgi:hypothetical protein
MRNGFCFLVRMTIAMLACLSMDPSVKAECHLDTARSRLLPTTSQQDGSSDILRANLYLGAGCADEATSFFDSAKKKITLELREKADFVLPFLANQEEVARILQLLQNDHLVEAQDRFLKLIRSDASAEPLAFTVLGPSMHLDKDESLWTVMEPYVWQCMLSSGLHTFWCKDAEIQHLARQKGVAEAITAVESILKSPQPEQNRTEFLILYSELLVRNSREAEATLLLQSLRPEIERFEDQSTADRYLSLCTQLWGRRVLRAHSHTDEDIFQSCSGKLQSLREGLH